eukprot:1161865-Pelagomonas_calceolata.AAC.2
MHKGLLSASCRCAIMVVHACIPGYACMGSLLRTKDFLAQAVHECDPGCACPQSLLCTKGFLGQAVIVQPWLQRPGVAGHTRVL